MEFQICSKGSTQMKKIGLWMATATIVLLTGCESQELVTCRQDKETLLNKTTALQQELDQAVAALQQKDAEIVKIKAQNIDMQNKAMESIMTMLKKEEDRSRTLQAVIAEKEAALKTTRQSADAASQKISDLETQIETLQSKAAEKAALSTDQTQ